MIKNEKRFFIKCFGILLFVLFGFCVNSSFAMVQVLEKGEELVPSAGGYNTTYTQGINDDGSFYLSNGSVVKNGLAFNYLYNYSSFHYPGFQFWGEYKTGYALFQFAENRSGNSSIYTQFRVYPYISMVPNKQPTLNCSATKPDNFTGNVCYYKDINELGEEYNGKFSGLYFDNNRQLISCFIFEEMNEVFCPGNPVKTGNNLTVQWTGNAISFVNFEESLVKYPIFISKEEESGGGTFIPLDSDVDMVINYYEQRGYRESMCYVGTDNLTATFGDTGIFFNEGSGDSIFGLYNSIYDGFGNNIIQNVGKFINVRDINYGQWFYCDSENCPRWLAELTGNDVNINLNYTGLSFPFANKPVAIYFMASNLSETYNIDTHGQDVAFYCYSKLNRDSIADGSIDYSDIKEKAGSGVLDKIDTYNQYLIDYYTPKGTFQVPTSGEFWDSFLSGEDYSGVNNVDMSDTFSNYFTRITNIFQNYSPLYSTGIIPDWIIFPLIFLILFRIMKH